MRPSAAAIPVVHAATSELDRQGAPGQAPLGVAGPHEHLGVRRVVDESDVGEPVQEAGRHRLRHVSLRQRLRQLRPAARSAGEQAQQDRPCDLLRVRLGVDRGRTGGRRFGGG